MISRILPIILVLIAIGLFFGYIDPEYTGPVKDLQSEIRGYDSALKAADTFHDREAEIGAATAALPPDALERINAFLPDGVDNVQLILDLNALASRSGISLGNFAIEDTSSDSTPDIGLPLENGKRYESLDISISAIGTYTALRSFLEAVEWSLRPLDLVELQLSESATGVYTYEMTFRIYWLP